LGIAGAVDLAHAALAKLRGDVKMGESCADHPRILLVTGA
jgi:hypothetical protein